ncbi:cyclin [Cryptosporidium canis]|uniref:Cyclin n=1 Tax=Cryptosporidium canis TaxID=195482 RepID=A0A9D5HWM5_9CRYT|nr:cyclin [Cryptosporidium canis]
MSELEDSLNEISSHEWESNLARIICGSLVNLSELIEDISDEELHRRLAGQDKFCTFECFFEPLLYYKNKHNLPPNMPRLVDLEDEYIPENPLYSESENKDLNELFRFGKTPKVSIKELFGFVLSILHVGGFNVSSFVLSVINMVNFGRATKIPICQHNWRPIFVVALVVSDKFWDDSCAKSGDMARSLGFISPTTLKYLELVFCKELDWKITFKLDTIKTFISKIVSSKLDSGLIETVISSATYQSYCHEGINDQNVVKCEVPAEKMENKNMMNSLTSSDFTKISNQRIGQRLGQLSSSSYPKKSESPSLLGQQQAHYPRFHPSLFQQPQLQRGASFHGNLHGSYSQASNPSFVNIQAIPMPPRPVGNHVSATHFVPHQFTSHSGSDFKKPSITIPSYPGGLTPLNKQVFNPPKSQLGTNHPSIGSIPGLKTHITSLTSPKSDIRGKIPQFPVLPTKGSAQNQRSQGISARENLSTGNYARSVTPDVYLQKATSPIKNQEASSNMCNTRTGPSSFSERGRDTSCLAAGFKHPPPSHSATRMNSNPNTLEKRVASNPRFVGNIKRSSSEYSRLNPTKHHGGLNVMHPPLRPPSGPQNRANNGDGFFSMARNKVSSAFSSITRTFGLTSAEPKIVLSNPSPVSTSPEHALSGSEHKLDTLGPSQILQNPSQDSSQADRLDDKCETNSNTSAFASISSNQSMACSNPRKPPETPKTSSSVLQTLSSRQDSTVASQAGSENDSSSSKAPTPKVLTNPAPASSEGQARAFSTDRTYKSCSAAFNSNHIFQRYSNGGAGSGRSQVIGNILPNSNKIHEKQQAGPLSTSWTPNSSSNRPHQAPSYNNAITPGRYTGTAHATGAWRHSVSRGPTPATAQDKAPQNLPSAGNSLFGRIGGGASLSRNVSLGAARPLNSQTSAQAVGGQPQATRASVGLLYSIFGGKPRIQSSGPSHRTEVSQRRSSLHSVHVDAPPPTCKATANSSLFSIENFISPIGHLFKGGSSPSVSSSLSKPPGFQISSRPGLGMSAKRPANLSGTASTFGSVFRLVK